MRARPWRTFILVCLVAALSYLVYQRGFGLQLGAPPSAVKTPYHSEDVWIVGEITQDLVRMCVYASHHQAADAMAPTVTVTRASAPAAGSAAEQAPAYDVRVTLARGGTPIVSRLTLPHDVWTPDDYVPFVRRLLIELKLSPAPSPLSDDTARLVALLDLRPSTIERENAGISARLQRDMLDARAHEDAALLLGAFGLREAASKFTDYRETLSRMAAHLAMARARESADRYGVSGRYADVLRLIMTNRAVEALAGLDGLDRPGVSANPVWNRALRMRVTHDWRDSLRVSRECLLERLEFFRARVATIPSMTVINELDDTGRQPLADWGRIVIQTALGPESGHRFARGHLDVEMKEISDVWQATHDGAPLPALGTALNDHASGCLTPQGPRVIGWGTWARFFQRHLGQFIYRIDQYYRWSLGMPDEANAEGLKLNAQLSDFDLFPMASCLRRRGPNNDELDLTRIGDAIRLTIRAPELMTASNWMELERGAKYEAVPLGMPGGPSWFIRPSAEHFPYDAWWRVQIAVPSPTPAQQEAMLAVSPFDFALAYSYGSAQVRLLPKQKQGAQDAKVALMVRLMQPRLDYDVHARVALEGVIPDGDLWRQYRTRTCELATEYCAGLAASLADAGKEREAAALYQRVIDDETVNRVFAANESFWLVRYYHRTGQAAKARRIAKMAASVGSAGGLWTLAWLMEQTGEFEKAEQLYETRADRYDIPQDLIAFYYRMARVRGDKDYESALAAALPRVFPHGLERFDPKSMTAAPKAAVYVMSETELARKADVRPTDLIVGLDGWRTETLRQYETVRAFTEDADLDLTIWRDGLIQRKAHGKNRRLGIELRSYPFKGWSG
jgi:hypothetical protein